MATPNTPIKFTPEDKEMIREIRERLNCVSLADAIRQSLRMTLLMLRAQTITLSVHPPGKNREKSKDGT